MAETQIPLAAWKSTVPIVAAVNHEVHHLGTGTLLRIADHFLIITAGHVFERAQQGGVTLGIGGARDGRFTALTGETFVTSNKKYRSDEDPLDIGLSRLPMAGIARFCADQFLSLNDVEFDDQPPTAVYTMFGFPEKWSTPSASQEESVTYKALQFTAYRFDGDTSELSGFQDRLHLAIDSNLVNTTDGEGAAVAFADTSGVPLRFPKNLNGISGCSVWRIGDLGLPLDKWSIERSRLVAVQTGVYSSASVIKATRWIAVRTLIHEVFPEVRPAMKLLRMR